MARTSRGGYGLEVAHRTGARLVGLDFSAVAVRQVVERADWRLSERSMWEEAAALDPGDDPALRSLRDEGVRSLGHHDALRRVLATATAPTREPLRRRRRRRRRRADRHRDARTAGWSRRA